MPGLGQGRMEGWRNGLMEWWKNGLPWRDLPGISCYCCNILETVHPELQPLKSVWAREECKNETAKVSPFDVLGSLLGINQTGS